MLRMFQHCSGLKIDIEKTQAKYLGSLKKIMTTSHMASPGLKIHLKHLLFSQIQLNKITYPIFNQNC